MIYAKSGCCSWHNGVCGDVCCDGTELSTQCDIANEGLENIVSKEDITFPIFLGAVFILLIIIKFVFRK